MDAEQQWRHTYQVLRWKPAELTTYPKHIQTEVNLVSWHDRFLFTNNSYGLRVFLYSSIHFCSSSPLGSTTNVRQPSFSSNPSLGSPGLAMEALKTSRSVIFFPTFNNLPRCVIAYTTRRPSVYWPFWSHSGGGACGGNIALMWAAKGVSSWYSAITSVVAY